MVRQRTKIKSCVIYNAEAGSTDQLRQLIEYCVQLNQCELRPSQEPGEVDALVGAALDDEFGRFIVAGGDGTVSQVINALAPDFDRVELALLPFGTGNDFARSLGIPLDEEGIRDYLALDRPPVRTDIATVENGTRAYFANAANGGLGGSVAMEVEPEDKARWGPLAYWVSAISAAMEPQSYRASIELDGELVEQEIAAITVANGRYVGGGFPVAPDALIDDGYLDVTVVPPLPAMELARSGLTFVLNRADLAANVWRDRARRIRIHAAPQLPFSIDGELKMTFDATFEVVPRALQVIPGPLASALAAGNVRP